MNRRTEYALHPSSARVVEVRQSLPEQESGPVPGHLAIAE